MYTATRSDGYCLPPPSLINRYLREHWGLPAQGQISTPFLSPPLLAPAPNQQPAFISHLLTGDAYANLFYHTTTHLLTYRRARHHLFHLHKSASQTDCDIYGAPHGRDVRLTLLGSGRIHPAFAYPTSMERIVICISDGVTLVRTHRPQAPP